MKRIEIKVIPNSKVEKVIEGEPLVVKVREPPKKGRANKAAVKLLSKYFGARMRIASGAKRRRKIVEIEGA
jgi:uncharacterized protein (TIGR00251 family)